MKDVYYLVKSIFLIVVMVILLMLFVDYKHDKKQVDHYKQKYIPELEKLFGRFIEESKPLKSK